MRSSISSRLAASYEAKRKTRKGYRSENLGLHCSPTRQVQAILASPLRTSRLSTLDTPTIVVHGDEDPILIVAHAKVLTRAIPNAKLHIIEGMGHAVPWGHWDLILPLLLEHFHQVSG